MNVTILEMSSTIHELRVELSRAVQEIERLKAENKEKPPVKTEGSPSANQVGPDDAQADNGSREAH